MSNSGHRIITGHVSVATLLAAASIVKDFPLQSDQDAGARWGVNSIPPEPAKLKQVLSRKIVTDGYRTFSWEFTGMTYLMKKYWHDQFMASTAYSGNVTVLTYNEYDIAVYLQCVMQRRVASNQIAIGNTGVIYDFSGTFIT